MKEKILSASRIKTLENCSWKYWCTYHQDLPSTQNSGAARGIVCHLILELLLPLRRRKYIKDILKKGTVKAVPAIPRLIEKGLRKQGFYDKENCEMCDDMILVGLNCNFLGGKGAKITKPEAEFLLESESPKYKIRGFIDKPIEYAKDKKVIIVDYKTSKNKLVKNEIEYNVQAMAYILAAKQMWPKLKDASIEFQFLRFPKSPTIEIRCTDEQLEGFELYLEYIYDLINKYTEEFAESNFAYNQPRAGKDDGFVGPLSCGFAKEPGQLKKDGNPMWYCEYKFAYDYYVSVDEDFNVTKSTKDKKELKGRKGTIEKRHYGGCPAHYQPHIKAASNDDDFDF